MTSSTDQPRPSEEYSTTIDMEESAKLKSRTLEEVVSDLIIARDSQSPIPLKKDDEWEGDRQVYVRYLEFRDIEGHAVPEFSPKIATCFIIMTDAPLDPTSG